MNGTNFKSVCTCFFTLLYMGPSIKDVRKRGKEGQSERTHADMGGEGSSKGGRPLLVNNRSTELFRGEKIL